MKRLSILAALIFVMACGAQTKSIPVTIDVQSSGCWQATRSITIEGGNVHTQDSSACGNRTSSFTMGDRDIVSFDAEPQNGAVTVKITCGGDPIIASSSNPSSGAIVQCPPPSVVRTWPKH